MLSFQSEGSVLKTWTANAILMLQHSRLPASWAHENIGWAKPPSSRKVFKSIPCVMNAKSLHRAHSIQVWLRAVMPGLTPSSPPPWTHRAKSWAVHSFSAAELVSCQLINILSNFVRMLAIPKQLPWDPSSFTSFIVSLLHSQDRRQVVAQRMAFRDGSGTWLCVSESTALWAQTDIVGIN